MARCRRACGRQVGARVRGGRRGAGRVPPPAGRPGRPHRAGAEHARAGHPVSVSAALAGAAAPRHHRWRVPHDPAPTGPARARGDRDHDGADRRWRSGGGWARRRGGRPYGGGSGVLGALPRCPDRRGTGRGGGRVRPGRSGTARGRLSLAQRGPVFDREVGAGRRVRDGRRLQVLSAGRGELFPEIPAALPAEAGADRVVRRVRDAGSRTRTRRTRLRRRPSALRGLDLRSGRPLSGGGGVQVLSGSRGSSRSAFGASACSRSASSRRRSMPWTRIRGFSREIARCPCPGGAASWP